MKNLASESCCNGENLTQMIMLIVPTSFLCGIWVVKRSSTPFTTYFSPKIPYIYVINLKRLQDEIEEETLNAKFWLESLNLHAPKSPVVIVGTHMDALNIRDVRKGGDIFRNLNETIKGFLNQYDSMVEQNGDLNFFPISNNRRLMQKTNIKSIRDAVETIMVRDESSLKFLHSKIRLVWLQCMDPLVSQKDYLPLEHIKKEAKDFGIEDDWERMLEFFNKVGYIIYFPSLGEKPNYVILRPQWLMTMFAKFILDEEKHGASKLQRVEDKSAFKLYFKTARMSIDMFESLFQEEETYNSMVEATLSDFVLRLGIHLLVLATYSKGRTLDNGGNERKTMVYVAPLFDTKEETSEHLAGKEVHFFVKFASDEDWPKRWVAERSIPQGFFCRILCYFANKANEFREATAPVVDKDYGLFPYGTGLDFEVFLDQDHQEIRFSLGEHCVHQANQICILAKNALKAVLDDIRGNIRYHILCNADGKTALFKDINRQLDEKKDRVSVYKGMPIPVKAFEHFYVSNKPPVEYFDCFLSHCWGEGEVGHRRVSEIYHMLQRESVKCWFDEVYMSGNINEAMTKGLKGSNKYVVFITGDLDNKIADSKNNVTKEFEWIHGRPSQRIVYVVLDSEYLDRGVWSVRLGFAVPQEAVLIDMTSSAKMQHNLGKLVDAIMLEEPASGHIGTQDSD